MEHAVETSGAGRSLRQKLVTEERYVPAPVRRRLYVSASVLIVAGSLLFASLVVQVVQAIGIVGLDHVAQRSFVRIRTPLLTGVDDTLAVVFGPIALPIIVLVVLIAWIVLARHLWRPLLLAGGMIFGLVLVQVLTRLVRRPRPPVDLMLFGKDTTYSFPSGHVTGTADFLLLMGYLLVSRNPTVRRIVVASVVAVVGIVSQVFSRMYLGYHWFSDTLAALCLAMVVVGSVIAVDTWRTVRIPGEKVTGELSTVQTERT